MKCKNNNCPFLDGEKGCADAWDELCADFIPSDEQKAVETSALASGSVSKLDQAALNTVAADMRKTAMKYVQAKDNARLMRAAELLALAIEKDASRIGALGLMKPNAPDHTQFQNGETNENQ